MSRGKKSEPKSNRPEARKRAPEENSPIHSLRKPAFFVMGLLALLVFALVWFFSRPTASRNVIFVGLDGADWQLLDRLIAEGRMPQLARLSREGRSGVLRTEHPPLSPLLWTTMMTGLGPLEHGILDFQRFHPATGQRQPITSDERRTPAVWTIASSVGRNVAVLGFWATWPAEPVRGLLVSDRLFSFQHAAAPPPGIVFPPEREPEMLQALQQAEQAVTHDQLADYFPDLTAQQYADLLSATDPYVHPASALRRILVETEVYRQLGLRTLRQDSPQLALLYVQGTDTIGHVFAPYVAPRVASVSLQDFQRYSTVPDRYYARIDQFLGEIRVEAEKTGAVVFLASDHGFHWGEGRPQHLASAATATAGRWHRSEGMYLLWGPGIQPEPTRRESGGIRQVAATLLALSGLAPGQGMAGPPLAGLPAAPLAPVDYRQGYHPATTAASIEQNEEIEKLQALGYIGSAEPSAAPRPGLTRTAGSFNNEGLIRLEQGDRTGARMAFQQALEVDPHLASALWNLSDLLSSPPPSGSADPATAAQHRQSDDLLLQALTADLPEGPEKLLARALQTRRQGQTQRAEYLVDQALLLRPDNPQLRLLRGRWKMDVQDCATAFVDFREAARLRPDDPLPHASAGLAAVCLGDEAAAAESLGRSLDLDPNQPEIQRFFVEVP